jgi:hypothetical protein
MYRVFHSIIQSFRSVLLRLNIYKLMFLWKGKIYVVFNFFMMATALFHVSAVSGSDLLQIVMEGTSGLIHLVFI